MNFFDSKYQNENSPNVKKLNSFNSVTDTTQMSATLFDENSWKLSSSPHEYEFNRFVDSKIEAFDFAPEFETKCYVIHSKSLRFDKNSSLSNISTTEEQNERANDIYKDECLSEAFDSCLNDDI